MTMCVAEMQRKGERKGEEGPIRNKRKEDGEWNERSRRGDESGEWRPTKKLVSLTRFQTRPSFLTRLYLFCPTSD